MDRATTGPLDASRIRAADEHLRRGLDDGAYGAAVLLVAVRGHVAHRCVMGELHPGGPACRIDSLFDLASLTKPVTAMAVLTLVEQGAVLLTDPVSLHLPESQGTALGGVTLVQLATHVSGLPAWIPLYEHGYGADAAIDAIVRTPLAREPGAGYEYSDLNYVLLGQIAAGVAHLPLERLVAERVGRRLGWRDTGYLPGKALRERAAATGNCPGRPGRLLHGEVHDANAHFMGGVSGHAGLFGTAEELIALGCSLLPGAARPLLSAAAARLATTSRIPASLGGQTVGWFASPNPMLPRGDLLCDTTFGHTGFTGTLLTVDPEAQLVVTLLTNRVIDARNNGAILRTRKQVLNAVASALTGDRSPQTTLEAER
jgi:CubicO group peptidase (beta-lactamase class C family)